MKNRELFLPIITLILFLLQGSIHAQGCETPPPDYDKVMKPEEVDRALDLYGRLAETYTVRIKLHIIRNAAGTNGPTVAEALAEAEVMEQDFQPHDICFVHMGDVNEILSDYYASSINATKAGQLNTAFGNANRIDIFILPSSVNHSGNAYAIPNNYLTMGEQRFGLRTMSHEVGHCLNLIHTHETYGQNCPSLLIERVDGSNCATAADLCCDTDADPNLSGQITFPACNYTNNETDCNGDTYNPNTETNIMSYTNGNCRSTFTTCQRGRMQAELLVGLIGTNLVSPDAITLIDQTISSGETYVTAGDYITVLPIFGGQYLVNNSAEVMHNASNYIVLFEGFRAVPSSGKYEAIINPFCNMNISPSPPPAQGPEPAEGEVNLAESAEAETMDAVPAPEQEEPEEAFEPPAIAPGTDQKPEAKGPEEWPEGNGQVEPVVHERGQ